MAGRLGAGALMLVILPALVLAQELKHVVPLPGQWSLQPDGTLAWLESEAVWRPICNSDASQITPADIALAAEAHAAAALSAEVLEDSVALGGGFDLRIFLLPPFPNGVSDSLLTSAKALVEQYFESTFTDPVEVRVEISFANLGTGGVLGFTASSQTFANWAPSRTALVSGMDADDIIQPFLPTGATFPVRYDAFAGFWTQENRVKWSHANYRAAQVGSLSGSVDAQITINTQYGFDYDPTDGVQPGKTSFVDVLVHEIGHAMGFFSMADDEFAQDSTSLDLFRFQRSDGSMNFNPDTYGDFQATPRLVDQNAPGQIDDVVTDLIEVEYQMADGDPWQASHFRQQANPVGLMAPTLSPGITKHPNYFSVADLAAFDAIGWDFVGGVACPASVASGPVNQVSCIGGSTSFSVVASAGPNPQYQWRKGTTNLTSNGHYSGVQTATLTISGVQAADAANNYNCVVTNPACGASATSANAALVVNPLPVFQLQPQSQVVRSGEDVIFIVSVQATLPLYQWRRNGVPVSNDDQLTGATSSALVISGVTPGYAGVYDCVVTEGAGSGCSVISEAATLSISGKCPADLNFDGLVDLADLGQLLTSYAVDANGDVDGDGDTDLGDLGGLLQAYGTTCP